MPTIWEGFVLACLTLFFGAEAAFLPGTSSPFFPLFGLVAFCGELASAGFFALLSVFFLAGIPLPPWLLTAPVVLQRASDDAPPDPDWFTDMHPFSHIIVYADGFASIL
jgi:hypothetical protein